VPGWVTIPENRTPILVGAALIGVVQNEMVMLNINPLWHKIVISTVLIVAITLDYARRRQQ
jgi:predicted ABC-type sugar transport system permease subunit